MRENGGETENGCEKDDLYSHPARAERFLFACFLRGNPVVTGTFHTPSVKQTLKRLK